MENTRELTKTLIERVSKKNEFIQILVGPRQVGKTTAVRQVEQALKDKFPVLYSASDLAPEQSWIASKWEEARLLLKNSRATQALLILDEVQLIDQWQKVVKANWDEDKRQNIKINLIITGSSALLLKKGSESLAGRFEQHTMLQWSFNEMQQAFDFTLDDYIIYGGYPGSASLIRDEKRWKEYIRVSLIETVLTKDLILQTRIQKPALLKQMFYLLCNHPAEIVSLNKLMGQLEDAGNITTLADYAILLEDAFLIKTNYNYSGSVTKSRASKPKWIIRDNALCTTLLPFSVEQIRNSPIFGHLVENSIIAHLLRQNIEVQYWRDKNLEVDAVLKQNGILTGIEIKSGRRIRNKSGLISFTAKYPKSKTLVVGANGIGIENFLKSNL